MDVSSPARVWKVAFFLYLIFQASSLNKGLGLRKCMFSWYGTESDSCFPSSLGANSNFGQLYSDRKGEFYLKNL